MPNALRIGLLGPLQLRDETGRLVHVGGRQLRVLLTLLAMNAGRVVSAGSLAGQIWPDDAPGNPGNALQTLVSRLRAHLFDRDPDRAFAMFDRYSLSEDPWVRAAAPLLRATFGSMLGRMEWAESDCQAALTAFRAIGEAWGAAAVLMTLAESAKLRGDFAAAVAALEEAAELGEDLGAWGDLSHIGGKLASVRLRAGDLAGARADLEQAERGQAERVTGPSDAKAWLSLVRAELLCREGDFGAAGRLCAEQLTWLDGKQSAWWNGTRAIVLVRLAMIARADGDRDRSRALLADALSAATDWVELPAIADVVDAIAVHAAKRTVLAATLLGAAHSIRGCFDEGSLDAPAVRDCLRARLGPDEFEAAYERGRALARDDALALAAGAVADPVTAG